MSLYLAIGAALLAYLLSFDVFADSYVAQIKPGGEWSAYVVVVLAVVFWPVLLVRLAVHCFRRWRATTHCD